jgi:hypothetical protein
LGYCGSRPAGRIRSGSRASLTAPEYGYKEIDVPPVPSLNEQPRRMTSNRPNPGLAAMPPKGRPRTVDGRDRADDPSLDERRLRETMARQSQTQAARQQASYQTYETHGQAEWDESDFDGDHDEAAAHRTRRLL